MKAAVRVVSLLGITTALAVPMSGSDALVSDWELQTPIITDSPPAAGKRVRVTPPEYQGTDVYNSLYLPSGWQSGETYAVIVEYTGNYWPPSGSSGEVKDANLGYGLGGPAGFIWVVMPYIEAGRQKNAVTWWGDKQATVDYCKLNLPRICATFGGDPDKVVVIGFSRGAIGTSYLGLADDEIADLWQGLMTFDHFDGAKTWNYPDSDRAAALDRLSRLKGKPVLVAGGDITKIRDEYLTHHRDLADFSFLSEPVAELFDIPEKGIVHPHTDLWMHHPSAYRDQARQWLRETIGD